MKKILAATAIGGALFAGSLGLASTASATQSSFVETVHSIGIFSLSGDDGILKAGYQICGYLAQGYLPEDVANRVYFDSIEGMGHDRAITWQQALGEVYAANTHLCPGASGHNSGGATV